MIDNKLLLIELNEINFDIVKKYINTNTCLPNFKKIVDGNFLITESESEYENLEPWIQWPSVHTGLPFKDHKIFRLGDFVNCEKDQIFEKVENAGFKVGAISPMNASNKLKSPEYFIPDPWTRTNSDDSFLSRSIASAVSQAVNDNSNEKITLKSLIILLYAFILFIPFKKYLLMLKLALSSRNKPWRKALFLDLLLHSIHLKLFKKKAPNFSTLFLNAGAHIQHHYFYNSPFVGSNTLKNPKWYIKEKYDPFREMLEVYDIIIGDYFLLNTEIILATGLSQKPFEILKFYYRLRNHELFLNDIGIKFKEVIPRMTRDFLITFASQADASNALDILSSFKDTKGVKIFDEIEFRGKELFVVLTYSNEINKDMLMINNHTQVKLYDYVTFVAIKNGEHQSKGYVYFSEQISKYAPSSGSSVHEIHDSIVNFFSIENKFPIT